MASTFGEGDVIAISGSCSAASPLVLCDFTPTGGMASAGVDGQPVNGLLFFNCDTTSTYVLHVKARGLHDNNTTSSMTIPPGGSAPLQIGLQGQSLQYVVAWPSTFGNATFSGTIPVCGGVMTRR